MERIHNVFVDGSVAPATVLTGEFVQVWQRNSGNPVASSGIFKTAKGKLGFLYVNMDHERYFISADRLEDNVHYPGLGNGKWLRLTLAAHEHGMAVCGECLREYDPDLVYCPICNPTLVE